MRKGWGQGQAETYDGREDYGEGRWATIGLVWSAFLFLYAVCTVRGEGKIRPGSARKANGKEARQYHEANP